MKDELEALPLPSIDFPYSLGAPTAGADFRSTPDDFIVDENLGFSPDGAGEHLVVQLRKRSDNTAWIVDQLATHFGLKPMDIGFCGLKDRHAVTSQWFSVYLPKTDPANDEAEINRLIDSSESELVLLAVSRHSKKLRRGQHHSNLFKICLRNLTNADDLSERLTRIAERGVPNYFGEQRFGRGGSNLYWARRWFEAGDTIRSRNKKVMAKSAARSYLYNLVLAARVEQGNWFQTLDGLPESNTGPLWGRGRSIVAPDLAAQEAVILEPWQAWLEGLEHVGLTQERRLLRLMPENFSWVLEGESLTLNFALPPGTYATSILRELAVLDNRSSQPETVDG
ncbi:tRNA pseudouridine(13) synthase TruD [Teredinibacter purpureus]|uniref:tRNA pseudouridine(13) synthase TruD n=1 Tax=Teredinibacter purpureus TaxID=2731756 RepID=UPI0005F82520|nr:tRNA pseudouridine(13) synthase TruD [Teredinibacter purpureus]